MSFDVLRPNIITDFFGSDGDTPEKQIAQIMAIAPILPGQKSTDKHIIPPRRASQTPSVPQPNVATTAAPQPHPPAPVAEDDLIDFGQNDDTPNEVHPKAPQVENHKPDPAQKDLEAMLASTSSAKAPPGPLLDFHDDMKKSLPAGGVPSLKRADTSESDEFVDAEG